MTFAVAIAGLWAVFTFFALRQSALAEADLREAEQRLAQWTAVEVSIHAEQRPSSRSDELLIQAGVKLTNKGRPPARLVYKVDD